MTMSMHERLRNQGCTLGEDGNWYCHDGSRYRRKVAVWGSSRTPEDSELYASIERMGAELVEEGWEVVTGGGPGNMEAANKGALKACPEGQICSTAEAIYLPFEEAVNEHVQEYEKHQEFFSRLKTFSNCDAFIITPGGVGTLLEMALIYQLVQVNHVPDKKIICVGRMWRTLRQWMEDEMLESGFLKNEEMKLVHYVDRFSEATALLKGLA
jgi:uncharacterized protein (TIGR00730 family)